MDDTKKMFQAIINGQSAMKEELLSKIGGVHNEVKELKAETMKGFKKTNVRIDNIGLQVARLEDDAPTREEHGELDKRVAKLEHKIAII